MNLQTGLPQALLFLLFMYLLLLQSHSHPMGDPSLDLNLERSGPQGPAQGMTWELQKEQGALERRRRSAEAREARQAASADGVGPRDQVRRDKVPRAFHAQRPTKAPASSCFGQKIDPISHHSGLGCNVLKKQ